MNYDTIVRALHVQDETEAFFEALLNTYSVEDLIQFIESAVDTTNHPQKNELVPHLSALRELLLGIERPRNCPISQKK